MTSDVSGDYIDGNSIACWLKSRNRQSPMIIGLSDKPQLLDPELFDCIYTAFLDTHQTVDIIKKMDEYNIIA